MVVCDRCESCYHRRCAVESRGAKLHDGPWFCGPCKGHIARWGFTDVMEDFGLINYLFAGYMPGNPEEENRIRKAASVYRAHGKELQVQVRGVDGEPTWVSVPPVPMRD